MELLRLAKTHPLASLSLSLSLFLLPSVGNVGVEEREFRNMTSERGEGRVRGRCTPI